MQLQHARLCIWLQRRVCVSGLCRFCVAHRLLRGLGVVVRVVHVGVGVAVGSDVPEGGQGVTGVGRGAGCVGKGARGVWGGQGRRVCGEGQGCRVCGEGQGCRVCEGGADPSKPHASRATVVSSQLLAHEGMPLTSLYEHMSPETLPFSTHAWRGGRVRVQVSEVPSKGVPHGEGVSHGAVSPGRVVGRSRRGLAS